MVNQFKFSQTLRGNCDLVTAHDHKADLLTNKCKSGQANLVIFDLFGTLVQYGVQHHPFRRLLKWARENGRQPKADDARTLMTINTDIPNLVASLGINAPHTLIEQIEKDIQEELNSLSLFADVRPTLSGLTERGISFAICSNLAAPYGWVVEQLLGDYRFIRCLSYEIGFIKPEIGIYQFLITESGLTPENCIFIGDTFIADYQAPIAFGMNARHLVRDNSRSDNFTITSLSEISALLDT
mgnify:CR=1 FL=1